MVHEEVESCDEKHIGGLGIVEGISEDLIRRVKASINISKVEDNFLKRLEQLEI